MPQIVSALRLSARLKRPDAALARGARAGRGPIVRACRRRPPRPASTRWPRCRRALQKLAALGVQRRYRTHALLIEEGDAGDSIYIVLSGPAARLRLGLARPRSHLGAARPGEYVGEMSLDGGLRSASVQAVEPTVCAVVTRETMLRHIAADPEFALGADPAVDPSRPAGHRERAQHGAAGRLQPAEAPAGGPGPGAGRTARGVIAERLTHQAIASEIGCSREMVSRLLKDLEEGGYLGSGRPPTGAAAGTAGALVTPSA